jgi:hypothetical protein
MATVSPHRTTPLQDALIAATFTATKRDWKRRKALMKLCQKHLRYRPEFAYYLAIGTVPTSLNVFDS